MKSRDFLDLTYPLPDPMYLVSGGGVILAANPAATEMLGVGAQALCGERLVELVGNSAEQVARYLKTCLRSRESIPGSLTWHTKDRGSAIACRCDGAALPPAADNTSTQLLLRCTLKANSESSFKFLNQELESLRVTHHRLMDQRNRLEEYVEERTEALRRSQQELERTTSDLARYASDLECSNRELDQFAYVTSHDLKAPLRAIANLSQWIEEDIEDHLTDDTRKQMNLLRGRVARMEALIDGVLEYSRVGRVAADVERVDVAALLDEIIDTLAPPEGIVVEVGSDMPIFEAARVRLSQVFSNLIGNAVKYHHRGSGCVQVAVSENGAFYEFTVADDGPGIASQYHDRVFQIFQTLQARDDVESTGVGLTLVKKIVEEQGGSVELESAEGQGATFRFTWPKTVASRELRAGRRGVSPESRVQDEAQGYANIPESRMLGEIPQEATK